MKNFIIYNVDSKILRCGGCADRDISLQAKEGEFILECTANDVTQKVEFDGLDADNQPINPRVVDKTPEEIEDEKLPEVPLEKQLAFITNGQLQNILDRLDILEKTQKSAQTA